LVALLSIVLHGTAIAMLVRRRPSELPAAAATPAPAPAPATTAPASAVRETITLEEVATLQAQGEQVVLADVRTARSYRTDPRQATGAVRLDPDAAVPAARLRRLPRDATIALYCT
ncbi:MAG: hypothetical protein H0W67_07185, partial [Gemmatimonadales bacterium]|nr:hypothetical protein [Gemmatimonadales bacterium]